MSESQVPLEETLLPALLQCFGIIILGFIFGKTKILSQSESKGLSLFVQKLSLPALIFTTISTIQFSQVKWEFIASVFVVKTTVFVCVVLISMLLTHPLNLAKSGMFAIAATQSNDFALGYPLIFSLYHTTHSEYPDHLYIIAPIQLLLLNSAGFFLQEIEKSNHNCIKGKKCHLFHILKDTLSNPVITMTVLGLIWNVSFNKKMLPIFGPILNAFSSAFPAMALFMVGYTMTARSDKSNSHISLAVALLILTKNLILPLTLQKVTTWMLQSSPKSEIQSFSSFAFLYGTIPTAPTVYVFACQYGVSIDTITKTIIGSTLLSAPLMFASASVISLSQIGLQNTTYYLCQTISYLSSVNAFGCIWLICMFCVGKRWRNVSFGVTFYLIMAQLLMSIGGVMLFLSPTAGTVLFYAQYILTNGSIYATSTCALLLAILLLIIRIRSLCFVLQLKKKINIISVLVCFILPYAIATSLLLYEVKDVVQPIFQLGFSQIVTTFVIRLCCLFGTILCLILQQVSFKLNTNSEANLISYQSPDIQEIEPNRVPKQNMRTKPSCSRDIEDLGSFAEVNCSECEDPVYEEDHSVCDSRYQCTISQRRECAERILRYISDNDEIGTGMNDNEFFLKHILLLLALSVGMVLSAFTCFWKLIMEQENGIFIEIGFLDSIVNYSLGILCCFMFGFENNILKVLQEKCKKLKTYNILFNIDEEEENANRKICENFDNLYSERCVKDIGETKTINNEEYKSVFTLENLITWLLEEEVTKCRNEAQLYTNYLIQNKLLVVINVNPQPTKPLYRFLKNVAQ